MRHLSLNSEQVSPNGNLMGQGMLNQLGNAQMDWLTLLVRETAQNSWDARKTDTSPIQYAITGYNLSQDQLSLLKKAVFRNLPPDNALKLNKWLYDSTIEHAAIVVADRNTVGLRGPTRADVIDKPELSNFVNFVRLIGYPSEQQKKGGTYGFGRVSLFRNSGVHTVCVHTHCDYQGKLTKRFIAIALGKDFVSATRRFTGRHWWGIPVRESDHVEPVTGDEADEIAYSAGMPKFSGSETGTSIVVLDPTYSGTGDKQKTPEEGFDFISKNIIYWLWPKMIPDTSGKPAMQFKVAWNGKKFPLPDPAIIPPWNHFVDALKVARSSAPIPPTHPGMKVMQILCERPQQQLGRLVLCKFVTDGITPANDFNGFEDIGNPVTEPVSHVALMRQPELVVKYLVGPSQPGQSLRYAGVFLAAEEVDKAFARSEPPTHDEWNVQTMDKGEDRTYVNVALRNIKTYVKEYVILHNELIPPPGPDIPLGNLAEYLADLLPIDGADIGGRTRGRSGSSKGVKARLSVLEKKLILVKGRPAISIRFEIAHAAGSKSTRVNALPSVAVSDGESMETEPPRGAEKPSISAWIDPNNMMLGAGPEIMIASSDKGPFTLIVNMIEDAAIAVDFQLQSVMQSARKGDKSDK